MPDDMALKQFDSYWRRCQACPIGKCTYRHALYSGTIPCTLLFLGEAPGRAEEIAGKPFAGSSGKVMRQILIDSGVIQRSLRPHKVDRYRAVIPYAFTNLIACRPCDYRGGPNRSPKPEEIVQCSSRLNEFIKDHARPKYIVAVGNVKPPHFSGDVALRITHPMHVLRSGGQRSDVYRATVDRMCALVKEMKKEGAYR